MGTTAGGFAIIPHDQIIMTSNFDAILVGDFRYPGGTSSAVASEVRALLQGGHSVALYQMDSPILTSPRAWNDRIFALAQNEGAVVLSPNTAASCRILLVHSPWLFIRPQPEQPQIKAALRIMVAHHTPTDANGRLNYDTAVVDGNARNAFGGPFYWAPISPVCRASFDDAGTDRPRLQHDWTNVIFVDDWGEARPRLLGDRPIVGRHSRPQLEKWPPSRAEVFAAYPPEMDVRLLGVGDEFRAFIAPIPPNWTLWEFNEVPVGNFLRGIDFFVYFHSPELTESFGLAIAEAAAAGCVVITHPYLEKTFGNACLYSSPEQAPGLVWAVAREPKRFAELSAQGRRVIDQRFGPQGYVRRLRSLSAASQDPMLLNELIVQPKLSAQLRLKGLAKRFAYWSRNGLAPGGQRVLQSKAIRRPVRKIRKALGLH